MKHQENYPFCCCSNCKLIRQQKWAVQRANVEMEKDLQLLGLSTERINEIMKDKRAGL